MSDSDAPECLSVYRGCKGSVTALDISPNGEKLAAGSTDNSILLQVLKNKNKAYRFTDKNNGTIYDVTFSPSGKFLASAAHDSMIRIWRPDVKVSLTNSALVLVVGYTGV